MPPYIAHTHPYTLQVLRNSDIRIPYTVPAHTHAILPALYTNGVRLMIQEVLNFDYLKKRIISKKKAGHLIILILIIQLNSHTCDYLIELLINCDYLTELPINICLYYIPLRTTSLHI